MKKKFKEWLRRYIPAEICATIGALGGAFLVYILTHNGILAAYAGTISENVGFYVCMALREVQISRKHHKKNNKKYGIKSFLKNLRNLLLEFGPAEFFDSLFVRPFCMYTFPLILGNFGLGIFAGKIIADVIFYIPTIIAYELKKKHLID